MSDGAFDLDAGKRNIERKKKEKCMLHFLNSIFCENDFVFIELILAVCLQILGNSTVVIKIYCIWKDFHTTHMAIFFALKIKDLLSYLYIDKICFILS